jgi:iron complex transport system permease protein
MSLRDGSTSAPRRLASTRVVAAIFVVIALLALVACALGPSSIDPSRVASALVLDPLGIGASGLSDAERTVVLGIRAPRVVLALLVGAALGGAGAATQGLFRNPLADPGLLGVSSGASLGAAVAIVTLGPALALAPAWVRAASLPVAAALGAALVTAAILALARHDKLGTRGVLLLAGIAVNALVGAVVGFLSQMADDAQLRDLVFWTLGRLGAASWTDVAAVIPWIVGAALALPRLGAPLDALALGSAEAHHLGVDVAATERRVACAVLASVGAAVSVAGLVGFVGLVVPHLARALVGPAHRGLVPTSTALGALLVLAADTLARVVLAPRELPVGLLTASLGAPFFLVLLAREARRA